MNRNPFPINAAPSIVLGLSLALLLVVVPARASVTVQSSAPGFVLPGIDAKQHSLTDFSGKPTALFFFCGCKWCHDTARAWALAERNGTVPKNSDGTFLNTLIVFSGDASEAKQFRSQTGLDAKLVTILTDKFLSITGQYDAYPCPRIFVLSADQKVLYTNNHAGDAPRTITGADLVTDAIKALGAVTARQAPTTPATPEQITQASEGTSSVYLTPLAGNGVTIDGTGDNSEAHYDFGTVKQSAVKTVEHVFQFRNDNPSPIIVSDIQPSCGCTNAFIDGTTTLPVTVNQGQTISVTAYVDLTDLYPASVEKSVMIFRVGQINPISTLDITGNLTP